MPCQFKFCGLRREDDVRVAVECGAAAVGFMLTKSPRQITPEQCAELRALVPEGIRTHGVFAHDEPSRIRQLVGDLSLDVAQVHGPDDDPAFWTALEGIPLVRAYRVRGPETLALLETERGRAFLLDAYVPGLPGGTGATFDWHLARQASAIGQVILAGGLTPENVADAIEQAQPAMVDVSGGIEREKGVKDHARMRAFAEAVRQAG